MFNPIRHRLHSIIPTATHHVPYSSDIVCRKILKVLDSKGDPLHPETVIPSQKRYKIRDFRDKKRFNAESYAGYIREMASKDQKQCHFDNRITYVCINNNHFCFTRAILIKRGWTAEKEYFDILEGKNKIRGALNRGLKLDMLFFTSEHLLREIPELDKVLAAAKLGEYANHGPVIMQIEPSMMKQLSKVNATSGLIAIFEKIAFKPLEDK